MENSVRSVDPAGSCRPAESLGSSTMIATEKESVITKTVIVTGAAGGMGVEALRILAQRDVNVVCIDLDQASVSQAIDDIGPLRGRFLAIEADVSDDAAVRTFVAHTVKEFGALHGV